MITTVRTSLVLTLICLGLSACYTENEKVTNPSGSNPTFASYGLLGKWEIQSRIVNSVPSGPDLCCEYFHFHEDANLLDLKGGFISISNGDTMVGKFKIINDHTLHFTIGSILLIRNFNVYNKTFTLDYTKNGQHHTETWKEE